MTPLRVTNADHWRPYSYTDENGEPAGALVEYWTRWSEVNKRHIEYIPQTWKKSINDVAEGKMDVQGGMVYSDERAATLDFTAPIMQVTSGLFVRDGLGVQTVLDLEERAVGMIAMDYATEYVRQVFPLLNLKIYRDASEVAEAARRGDIDALKLNYTGVTRLLQTSNPELDGFVLLQPLYTRELRAAVAKGNTDLLSILNNGIARMQAQPEFPVPLRWERLVITLSNQEILVAVTAGFGIIALLLAVVVMIQKRVLNRNIQALRESESRFRTLFEATPRIAVQGYDRNREVIYWNSASEDLYGYSRQEAMGRKLEDLIIPDPLREDVVQQVEGWVKNGVPIPASDVTLRAKDGSDVPVFSSHAMIPDADGEPELYCIDVSLAQLKEAFEELERSNTELEQFAYVASHDLREPLRMISSYLGLIERCMGTDTDPKLAEYFAFAKSGAERMDAMILDILALSRVGRQREVLGPVDLNAVVEAQRQELDLVINEIGAEFLADPDLPAVWGSKSEVARLFSNLISNALRYRDLNRNPRIQIKGSTSGNRAVISVTDNGIGIDPRFHDRVFRVFQRLHNRDSYPNATGIGLSICKKIVESHGGRIWIESTPGEGTTIFFTLPTMAN